MNCSICDSDKKVITHHLSYEPEITTMLCQKCHNAMHNLVGLSKKQINIIADIVEQYGKFWENGAEKYLRTEHYKNIHNKRGKEYNEITNYSKKYYLKNKDHMKEIYLKKLTPEKIIERLEKMEKRLGVKN